VSLVGNANLCGRTVSLAQTFGLHRDPSKWDVSILNALLATAVFHSLHFNDVRVSREICRRAFFHMLHRLGQSLLYHQQAHPRERIVQLDPRPISFKTESMTIPTNRPARSPLTCHQITPYEKATRIRIWWGVLITDYWTSIAYGTLPQISKRFYDVPMPTLESLGSAKASPAQRTASTCFIHLCALTELLGDILPLVYEISPDRVELSGSVRKLKWRLEDLERRLPEWLAHPKKIGTSNLWFCFLSLRLLLSRVTLRAAVLEGDTQLKDARLDELRASSSAVLDFILSLVEHNFLDFWLPYATHLLVHAVTVALRCTVETQDLDVRNACISRLERVIAHIQHAREHYDWDVCAPFSCLSVYEHVLTGGRLQTTV
jgi:hypothetical protein